ERAYRLSRAERCLLLLGRLVFYIGADRPQRFLAEGVGHAWHVHRPVAHRAVDHALLEPFVTAYIGLQFTQVRGDAAGDGFQPVATGAVLVVGRRADLHGQVVMLARFTIGVLVHPFFTALGQALGLDRMGYDITVCQRHAGHREQACGQEYAHWILVVHDYHLVS